MLEHGIVTRTEGDIAYVMFKRSSACGNCKACGMLKDMSEIELDVRNTLGAKQGDTVILESLGTNMLKYAAIAYGIPLVFLIIGIFLGYYYISKLFPGSGAELVAAISGIVFTAIAFLSIRLFDKSVKKESADEFKMVQITDKGVEQ